MTRTSPDSERERRRIFRQIEWAFVYIPPLVTLFFTVFGAAFLAFFIPIPGTTFWGRWAISIVVILVIPAVVYFVRERMG
jgi:hypothetical protein